MDVYLCNETVTYKNVQLQLHYAGWDCGWQLHKLVHVYVCGGVYVAFFSDRQDVINP